MDISFYISDVWNHFGLNLRNLRKKDSQTVSTRALKRGMVLRQGFEPWNH